MPEPQSPTRRGRAKNITLDHDAHAFLEELCGGDKTQGRYISALLRAEYARHEERQRLKEQVVRVFAETPP